MRLCPIMPWDGPVPFSATNLISAGMAVKRSVSVRQVLHPTDPDLAGLYGTIIAHWSAKVTGFIRSQRHGGLRDGAIDRSCEQGHHGNACHARTEAGQ